MVDRVTVIILITNVVLNIFVCVLTAIALKRALSVEAQAKAHADSLALKASQLEAALSPASPKTP